MGVFSKYECEGQMSIFDFMQQEEEPKAKQPPSKSMPWPCRECKWCDGCCCEYDKKPEKYGECNLFVSKTPNFDTMTIEEAVEQIAAATGLDFKPNDYITTDNQQEYEAKVKKIKVTVRFSHYSAGTHNGRRHLGIGIMNAQMEGYGAPCDSVEEAIEDIKKHLERFLNPPKKVVVCAESGHECNKEELWKVADSLDETECPHVCCRHCNTKLCGARCNGSEEPKEKTTIEKMVEKQASGASGLCENKDSCSDYPYRCKGECFWCHRNKNLQVDNCLNCGKYKIECFIEHPTAHGECPKYEIVPEWYSVQRCQACKNWSVNQEQPPAGHGTLGFCSLHKHQTGVTSYCNDFESEE